MKRLVTSVALGFSVALGIFVALTLPPGSWGVILGVILGLLGCVPLMLIIMLLLNRNQRQGNSDTPQIIVLPPDYDYRRRPAMPAPHQAQGRGYLPGYYEPQIPYQYDQYEEYYQPEDFAPAREQLQPDGRRTNSRNGRNALQYKDDGYYQYHQAMLAQQQAQEWAAYQTQNYDGLQPNPGRRRPPASRQPRGNSQGANYRVEVDPARKAKPQRALARRDERYYNSAGEHDEVVDGYYRTLSDDRY